VSPRPVLHISEILKWADAHFERTGKWPKERSGRVAEPLNEKWCNIDLALRVGIRGLPGGWSLAQLLAERRGVRNRGRLPKFTHKKILAWADAHRKRTGRWPYVKSGPIADALGETWLAVGAALYQGRRGLKGGSSLAKLLFKRRGVRNSKALPKLTHKRILAWADAHHKRTGRWPNLNSGPITDAPGEKWGWVSEALYQGQRGLKGGSSLAQLLAKHRGVRNI